MKQKFQYKTTEQFYEYFELIKQFAVAIQNNTVLQR